MKVVHICSSIRGGAGRAALRLHFALLDAGVDSKILTRWDSDESRFVYKTRRPFLVKVMERFLIPAGQLKYNAFYKKYVTRTPALTFPDALYDCSRDPIVQSADIINLHWVGNMLNYQKFFDRVHKPIVWTLHDMNPFLGAFHLSSDLHILQNDGGAQKIEDELKLKKIRAYKKAKLLTIAPLSRWMETAALGSPAFSNTPHTLVRNCVDVSIFTPKSQDEARKQLGLPENIILFLYVSQAVENPKKGYQLLRQAAEQLPEDCGLIVVGSGTLPAAPRIYNMGRIDDELQLSTVYASADAHILPSLEDNLPNTMLESLCCGVPVLSFQLGGMMDIINHGQNGLMSAKVSHAGILELIHQFCSYGVQQNRQQIAYNARQLFSPEKVAMQYINIYNRVLSDVVIPSR